MAGAPAQRLPFGTLFVILLAAGLRVYCLPEIPPGLRFDEGFKGATACGLPNAFTILLKGCHCGERSDVGPRSAQSLSVLIT